MIKYEDKIKQLKLDNKNKEMIDQIQSTGEALGLEIGDIDMSAVN